MIVKQISSLEKVTCTDALNYEEISARTVLQGERLSYQIAVNGEEERAFAKVWVDDSSLKDAVKLYVEKEVYVDNPTRIPVPNENYLLQKPGFLPDVLMPLDEQNELININEKNVMIWVKVDVPTDLAPGKYSLKINVGVVAYGEPEADFKDLCTKELEINVIPAVMPEQKLIYTRWFYADCIAVAHNVEIYSEKHWMLIEKYIAAAADVGINMLLVPIHTPPLDTEIGTARPCVQLVDIEKKGDVYEFGFTKFERFINICKKYGIKYYEMAHLFSQWGSTSAPNIMVTENGKLEHMFGWHVAADSDEYVSFLKQYIKAISNELEREGIAANTYFHVSDEPDLNNMDRYETARNIIKPLIGQSKTVDALSHVEFYEKGLVECPVTSIKAIHNFLPLNIENQWAYYCCSPETVYTNSFIAMPSWRTRVLGFQLYKFDIKGFLHWGFNFYNSCRSRYPINPYLTTSADGCFPSGDGFIVYPGLNTAYPSIRGEITYEAIQDINVCLALEELIGREKVVQVIDDFAGRDFKFDDYPTNKEFVGDLRAKMIEMIAELKK